MNPFCPPSYLSSPGFLVLSLPNFQAVARGPGSCRKLGSQEWDLIPPAPSGLLALIWGQNFCCSVWSRFITAKNRARGPPPFSLFVLLVAVGKSRFPLGCQGLSGIHSLHRRRRRFPKGRDERSRALLRDLCKSEYFYANFESTAWLVRGRVARLAASQSTRLIPAVPARFSGMRLLWMRGWGGERGFRDPGCCSWAGR